MYRCIYIVVMIMLFLGVSCNGSVFKSGKDLNSREAGSYQNSSNSILNSDLDSVEEFFVQGYPGTPIEDEGLYSKTTYRDLDILIVMDDSGSMGDEQNALSTRLPALINEVKDTNWRIGVIHTGVNVNNPDWEGSSEYKRQYAQNHPCLVSLIKKDDYIGADGSVNNEEASAAFKKAIQLGNSGDGYSQGILKAAYGLKQEKVCPQKPQYANWLRKKSFVAVLIVSDEDNCSNGNINSDSCISNVVNSFPYQNYRSEFGLDTYLNNNTVGFFTNFLKNNMKRTPGKDARVFGIVSYTTSRKNLHDGKIYRELVTQTSGVAGDIAASTYEPILRQISSNISKIVTNLSFDLSELPSKENPFEVYVDGNLLDASRYTVDGRKVYITDPELFDIGSKKIVFKYSYGSTRFKEVTLKSIPIEDSLVVKVDGTSLVPDSEWSYDPSANKIIFTDPPEPKARIQINYKILN